ncbi:hypothetical protein [Mangrovicella endophytica]|uniref:hypothetical protein n=1 Tax=Mangrovicella endophytica TaxID=2066697 RepID=UPI000C9DD63C|nr:hypothetical protein [Mangrovicella endophytica]
MPFFATAGSKVFIGGALDDKSADYVAADFTSQAWVEIKGLTQIGTFGDTSNAITSDQIGENRTKTIKGTRNAGTIELVADINYADAGQLAAIAAEKSPADFAIKIQFNDAPATGSSPKPSTRMMIGKVMSAAEALDQANNAMKLNISIAINSNIVRTVASAS